MECITKLFLTIHYYKF